MQDNELPYEPILWEILLKKWCQKHPREKVWTTADLMDDPVEVPTKVAVKKAVKVNGTKEISVRKSAATLSSGPRVLDFNKALEAALNVFKDQTLINKDANKITNTDIQLNRAKASSFFEGIYNMLHLGHIQELIEQDTHRFKREEELKALKPLLESFQMAAVSSQHNIAFITTEMERLLKEEEILDYGAVVEKPLRSKGKKRKDLDEDEEEFDATITAPSKLERMAWMQSAYSSAIDNMVKLTTGLSKVIQLERYSGGRQWGIEKGAGAKAGLVGLGDGRDDVPVVDDSKIKNIGAAELAEMKIDDEVIDAMPELDNIK